MSKQSLYTARATAGTKVFDDATQTGTFETLSVVDLTATGNVSLSDSLTVDSLTVSSDSSSGTGRTTTLTYYLGSACSWSSSIRQFGSYSLYIQGGTTSQSYNTNAGLMVGGLSSSDFSGAWTVEFWLYPTSLNGTVFSTTGSSIDNGYIQVYLASTGTLSIGGYNTNGSTGITSSFNVASAASAVSTNTWTHIAFGFNGTNRYFLTVGGTYSDTGVSSAVMDWSELGTTFCYGCSASEQFAQQSPFGYGIMGYIDEIRVSKTARYTASFTPPTSAFSTDINTIFLHHLEGSLIGSDSQEKPTLTTVGGTDTDSSGNLAVRGNLSSQVGSLSTVTGNITTDRGYVKSYQKMCFDHAGWRIGPTSMLNLTSALSASANYGVYMISSGGFDTYAYSSHNIIASSFLVHQETTCATASFTIFCNNRRGGSGTKQGVIKCEYLLQSATPALLYTISTTKTSNLSTFSVSAGSFKGITVSTDSDCCVAWHAIVAM